MTLWFNEDMLRINPRSSLLAVLLTLILTSSCISNTTPTPFRPPTQPVATRILSTITPIPALYTAVPTPTITVTVAGPCINDLEFLDDLTVEDNTSVLAGSIIDKQWLVKNSGTCNWNSNYRIKWIGGDPLGATQEQNLYPARAGTQATIRILFTAPALEGTYESQWQVYDQNGNAFGDPVYIQIVVTP